MSNFTRTRFAPSPTGLLHIGHAYSAYFAMLQASQGQFLLRIEDIDRSRCKPEFEASLLEDLKWLGFEWPQPVRKQSEHFADYQACLNKLDSYELLYPCFCTRKDIEEEIRRSPSAPHGLEAPLYPGTCRNLSQRDISERIANGNLYALRLNMQKAIKMTGVLRWHDRAKGWQDAKPEILGDVVIARKDTPASYHLCVTHDDAVQGISLVTRGEDLFHATHLHRLLQALLGLPTPDYHHHALLVDRNGVRFAKRNMSVSLRDLRNRGFAPEQVRHMIAHDEFHNLAPM